MKLQIVLLTILLSLLALCQATGSYQILDVDLSQELQNTQEHPLKDLQNFLRTQFEGKTYLQARQIGNIIKIEVQVVAGLNYRFTFENSQGQKLQATVFQQPWNRIRKMTHLNLLVEQDML